MTLTTNSNMRMELSGCDNELLEIVIIKWKLAYDYCNICIALMIYLIFAVLVASNGRRFSKKGQIKN
jgi:hypothetical protein